MAIDFDWQPVGKNGHIEVTICDGDRVIEAGKINVSSPRSRQQWVNQIKSRHKTIDVDQLEQGLIDIAAKLQDKRQRPPEAAAPDSEKLLDKMPESVKAEARVMLESSDLSDRIAEDTASLGVAGEEDVTVTNYMTGTSRLLSKPLATINQGLSSSGKSHIIATVARMFPPETVIHATQMTPQALFHMPPGSLSHKFVVAGERSRKENDDSADTTRALREMISEGRLVKLMPVKVGGEIQTQRIEQDGPIAYCESTTLQQIFEEDANRCILLTTDERPEQTRRVITSIARKYAGQLGDTVRIIDRHHAAQRMLKPWPIHIPYAERLGELFPDKRVEARRAFSHLLSMIQASALLHQYQRQVDDQGRLIATVGDYTLARDLLGKPMDRLLGGQLSDPVRRFYERLQDWAIQTFTAQDAISEEKKRGTAGPRAVYGYLHDLADAGLAEIVEEKRGRSPAKWELLSGDTDSATAVALPAPEALVESAD